MEVIESLEGLSLEQQKELKEKQEQEDINNNYNSSSSNNNNSNKNELNKQMEIFKQSPQHQDNNSDSNTNSENDSEYTTENNNNSGSNINSNENTSNDNLSEIDSLPSSPSIRSSSASGIYSSSSSAVSTSSFSNLGALVSPGGQAKLQQQQQKRKVIEGELVKRGHIFPTWRNRWFKIENGYLLYFKSKDEVEPIDKVPLRGSRVSKKPFHERPNTFELIATTMKKVFLLQAKDVDELDFWIDEIVKEIEYTRSLYSRTIQT